MAYKSTKVHFLEDFLCLQKGKEENLKHLFGF